MIRITLFYLIYFSVVACINIDYYCGEETQIKTESSFSKSSVVQVHEPPSSDFSHQVALDLRCFDKASFKGRQIHQTDLKSHVSALFRRVFPVALSMRKIEQEVPCPLPSLQEALEHWNKARDPTCVSLARRIQRHVPS